MTTINRATWTDDDGSGMTGTILNNARLQGDIYDRVDGALATLDTKDASQDTAIAANGPHSILSAQHPDTTPAALVAGDMLVVNASGKLVRLPKGADGSLLGVTSGAPAWALPTAGNWVTIPYSAGIFTASGSMTWTVSVAPSTLAYTIVGRTAMLFFNIAGTIGGTASTDLFVTLPFNPTINTPGLCRLAGASAALGLTYFLVGQSKFAVQPNAGGNHVLGVVNVQGTAFCQV